MIWVITVLPAGAQQLTSARRGELPYYVPRIEGAIVLDGRMDDPAWQAIEPLPTTMHLPTFGAPPSERTEFRLGRQDRTSCFRTKAKLPLRRSEALHRIREPYRTWSRTDVMGKSEALWCREQILSAFKGGTK